MTLNGERVDGLSVDTTGCPELDFVKLYGYIDQLNSNDSCGINLKLFKEGRLYGNVTMFLEVPFTFFIFLQPVTLTSLI